MEEKSSGLMRPKRTDSPGAVSEMRRGAGWYVGLPFRAMRLSLVSNAFYLMVNTAIGTVLGAVFWLVAARFYSESDVGFAAALIPLTLFIASAGTLGLSHGLIRFLPEAIGDPDRSREILNASMTLSGLVATALAVIFVLGIDTWAPSLSFIRIDLRFFATFVVFCGLFGIVPMIDAVAIAHRKVQYALARNTIFSGLRSPLPIAFVGILGIFGLFFPLVFAGFVAALIALFVFLPRLIPRYRPAPTLRLGALRPLIGFSLGIHAAGLLGGIAPSVLPLLVVELRSPSENAWFYIAWVLGSMLYVIPGSFTMSLFAEGSQADRNMSRDVRRTILGSAALIAPAALFLYFYGDRLLTIFGQSYAFGGFGLLRWLVLATPFVLINGIYLTLVLVEKRVIPVIAASAFVSLFTVGASWLLLPSHGLVGAGIGWFLSQSLVSLAVGLALVGGRVRL